MQGLVLMSQVHGNNIKTVDGNSAGLTIPSCDGLITTDENIAMGVRVADCLPVLIYCEKPKVVGLIHAGWRGLLNGILPKAVRIFKDKFGCAAEDLNVLIGPHICIDHFEFGPEATRIFAEYEEAMKLSNGKIFISLAKVATKDLTTNGIKRENIVISPDCTYKNPNLPSYRRDKTDKRLLMQTKLDRKHFSLGLDIL